MRWFEPHLQRLLLEAGDDGLRINDIVRNVCNMEPHLFGTPHPYDEAWKEIYQFLRSENKKPNSPYRYVTDRETGKTKRGCFFIDRSKIWRDMQMSIDFCSDHDRD